MRSTPESEVKTVDIIQEREYDFQRNVRTQERIGVCQCGAHVILSGFTNTCEKCGRDYNMNGTLLAPRSQWGEDTGETYTDIMSESY